MHQLTCHLGGTIQLGRMEVNPVASLKKLTVSQSGKNANEPSLLDIECDDDEFDEEGGYNFQFWFLKATIHQSKSLSLKF